MIRIKFLLLTAILSTGYVAGIANAQSQNQPLPQEAIISYFSNIAVNTDNSIDVTETITYDTGPQEHHGVFRDIYPYSSQKRKMAIENVTVTDENGSPYIFQISDSDGNLRIKIGDPNRTFGGQKIYVIKYHATRAIAQFKDFDEIYWNATGNAWGMPIYQVQASIALPSGANMTQSVCYYGPKGSTNRCQLKSGANNVYLFDAPSALNPGDGLTAAVSFQKGIVAPYSPSDAASDFLNTYWPWFAAAMV
jgi:hypothetical protein